MLRVCPERSEMPRTVDLCGVFRRAQSKDRPKHLYYAACETLQSQSLS
jgi:hypothetical protein